MICTFEKFVLPYVNFIVFVTLAFDLWMNKGALDTFALVIFFKDWVGNKNMSQLVYLR
jgi:hypothetical protein